jgi:hypothetical protein
LGKGQNYASELRGKAGVKKDGQEVLSLAVSQLMLLQ